MRVSKPEEIAACLLTNTAGVSRAFPEEPLDVIIGRADRAMYEGKQTGRNRCMFIDEQNVINRV
ncbi:hypothetical protein AC90_3199 [Escherichia coli 3-475-03_S4_C1]|nr:hypothetical protein AC90_3199 [Escherichia coli 3-475-03_S4_C1]